MKKRIFTMTLMTAVLLLFCGINSAIAQQAVQSITPEQQAQTHVNNLDKAVGLSAKQKETIYNLRLDFIQKRNTLRTQKPNQKSRTNGLRQAAQDYRKAREAVLTKAQKAAWKSYITAWQNQNSSEK